MKVKYTVSSKYMEQYRDVILYNEDCKNVNDIITVIINHIKSIDVFNTSFKPKQQYKVSFVKDKGFEVNTDSCWTNPERSFSDSLRSTINRSLNCTLIMTKDTVRQFHLWVYKANDDSLRILDGNPKSLNCIRFTIKVSLVEDNTNLL